MKQKDMLSLIRKIAKDSCYSPRKINIDYDPAGNSWDEEDCGFCASCLTRDFLRRHEYVAVGL